jgi:hypothetical protein
MLQVLETLEDLRVEPVMTRGTRDFFHRSTAMGLGKIFPANRKTSGRSPITWSKPPREKNKGEALRIADKYSNFAGAGVKNNDIKYLLSNLSQAVIEFNNIELRCEKVPRIGVVGEIYVKYNPMGNCNIVNMLVEEAILLF